MYDRPSLTHYKVQQASTVVLCANTVCMFRTNDQSMTSYATRQPVLRNLLSGCSTVNPNVKVHRRILNKCLQYVQQHLIAAFLEDSETQDLL